jgi:hypothetical protein
MAMLTDWIRLLKFLYDKYERYGFVLGSGWITFKDQNVYKSDQFYKIMNEFVKLGWVEEKYEKNGFIVKKQFSLTRKGFLVVNEVLIDVWELENGKNKLSNK